MIPLLRDTPQLELSDTLWEDKVQKSEGKDERGWEDVFIPR